MEAKLFTDIPEYTTPEWYRERERAPHLEEGAHRWRLLTAREFIVHALIEFNIKTVSDLGAGDGGLLSILADTPLTSSQRWGYDLQPSNIKGAQERGVTVYLRNVLTDDIKYGDLSVCTEMLEHLVDPHGFVKQIRSPLIVASSPVNETIESHYAFHLWAYDREGYAALLQQGGYDILEHVADTAFQVILGRRP